MTDLKIKNIIDNGKKFEDCVAKIKLYPLSRTF
jgi:hypothetical protein